MQTADSFNSFYTLQSLPVQQSALWKKCSWKSGFPFWGQRSHLSLAELCWTFLINTAPKDTLVEVETRMSPRLVSPIALKLGWFATSRNGERARTKLPKFDVPKCLILQVLNVRMLRNYEGFYPSPITTLDPKIQASMRIHCSTVTFQSHFTGHFITWWTKPPHDSPRHRYSKCRMPAFLRESPALCSISSFLNIRVSSSKQMGLKKKHPRVLWLKRSGLS